MRFSPASSPREKKRPTPLCSTVPLFLATVALVGVAVISSGRDFLQRGTVALRSLGVGRPCQASAAEATLASSVSGSSIRPSRILLARGGAEQALAAKDGGCSCGTPRAASPGERHLRAQIESLQLKAEQQLAEKKKLQEDKMRLVKDKEATLEETIKLQRKLAEDRQMSDELAEARRQLAENKQALAGLKEEMRRQVKEKEQAMEQLLSQMKKVTGEKEEALKSSPFSEGGKDCSAELKSVKERLASVADELELAKAERLSLQSSLKVTTEQLASADAENKAVKVEVSLAQDEAAALKVGGTALEVQLNETKARLAVITEELEATKTELAQNKEELAGSKEKASKAESALKDSMSALSVTNLEVAELRRKLTNVKKDKLSAKLQASLEQARRALKDAQAKASVLAAKLESTGKSTQGPELGAAAAQKLDTAATSSVDAGYKCSASKEDMERYLNYTVHQDCPNDWYFVQRLIFKNNCFSLPRRRCRAITPASSKEPLPLPQSLFDQASLQDRNVRWDMHQCKGYDCLNARVLGDCRDCFNLTLEEKRWQHPFRGTIPMKDVIAMKKGTLRLGLDVGGGTGSFAAHMARHGVTVMTTAFNVETVVGSYAGLPYMETIAARGLIPLHVPHQSRLPLFDGVLDVIHSVNSIKYIPLTQFEELIYEWDRVLRVGGIFWFEMFYTPTEEMPRYVAIIEKLGYKKLYWQFTPKTDAAEVAGKAHVYLNCVLEKQSNPGTEVLQGPRSEDMRNIV